MAIFFSLLILYAIIGCLFHIAIFNYLSPRDRRSWKGFVLSVVAWPYFAWIGFAEVWKMERKEAKKKHRRKVNEL